jgi:glucosylceramidase
LSRNRNRGRTATSVIGVAALATAAIIGVGFATTAQAAGPAVSVWETTTHQSQLLAPQTGASFASGNSSQSQVITVSPGTTYQSMTGFGASFTDSSASLVSSSPLRNQIMTKLFDPTPGHRPRLPAPADRRLRLLASLYSYDDVPSGQTDPNLTDFSISHDNAYIIPMLQQALSINPQTRSWPRRGARRAG